MQLLALVNQGDEVISFDNAIIPPGTAILINYTPRKLPSNLEVFLIVNQVDYVLKSPKIQKSYVQRKKKVEEPNRKSIEPMSESDMVSILTKNKNIPVIEEKELSGTDQELSEKRMSYLKKKHKK